jgi:hypothetical protein
MVMSLIFLKEFGDLSAMVSSWAEPLYDKAAMTKSMLDGERFLHRVDAAVKKNYSGSGATMDDCRNVLAELRLPSLFAMPMVHRAFMSHIV